MKRLILSLAVLAFSFAQIRETNASAILVSYTVSGSSGDYDLDFSVTNNMTSWNQNIYLFGVSLTGFNVTGSPAPFHSLGATTLNYAFYGGSSNFYTNNWQADPTHSDLLPGDTLSGFIIHDAASVAPTELAWFAWSQNAPGHNNEPYTGGGNFNHAFTDSNPAFEGLAQPLASTVTPEPSTLVITLILAGTFGVVWSTSRSKQSARNGVPQRTANRVSNLNGRGFGLTD